MKTWEKWMRFLKSLQTWCWIGTMIIGLILACFAEEIAAFFK